jgi:hypothetical protein
MPETMEEQRLTNDPPYVYVPPYTSPPPMFTLVPTQTDLKDWRIQSLVKHPGTLYPREHPRPPWQDNKYLNYPVKVAIE